MFRLWTPMGTLILPLPNLHTETLV